MAKEEAYILGTDLQELHRLGVQHRVWASEAHRGWELAGFHAGQTLLDLGCGPGFCSMELAHIVGGEGKIIAADRSENYINYLNNIRDQQLLNIETRLGLFTELELAPQSLDGIYTRWVLGWVEELQEVLTLLYDALKPGGRMVLQEYYDWSTHAIYPSWPAITHAINTSLRSFKELKSELDIGKDLPIILSAMGMRMVSLRLMPKLATPQNSIWQWPKTYYQTYFPKLIESGHLTQSQVDEAFKELAEIEKIPGANICGPLMIEVIAEKL